MATAPRQASHRRAPTRAAPAPRGGKRPLKAFEEWESAFKREREFSLLLQDVYALFGRSFDRRMRRLGLSRAQWRVLTTLLREDGRTQTEIADELMAEKAPLGRLIDRMEEAGFVERRPDAADRRLKRIHLTSKVEALLPAMRQAAEDLFAEAFAGLAAAQLSPMIKGLEALRANLKAAEIDHA